MLKKAASKGGPAASKPAASKSTGRQQPQTQHAETTEETGAEETGAGDDEGGSEADVFDSVKSRGAVADGKYEAVIKEFVLQPADEKGRSVRLKVVIADEGEYQGAEVPQWYKVFDAPDANGKVKAARGAEFLKADLAKLGYPDFRFADLEGILQEIVDNKTGVLVSVKQNGQFTNVYVNGLSEESQVIADFLASHPF